MRILVTGATGYVGGRLVPLLLERGHDVRTTTSDPDREPPWWGDRVETVVMDALDPVQVAAACEGMEAVYYLIHGMGGDNFAETDRAAATNLVDGVRAHGVERIVYLSGVVPDVADDRLSEHLRSRREVERILTNSPARVVILRAAVLLGSGSTSFEIIRQVSERMPVHTVPAWMDSLVQPIAVVDVLEALIGALAYDGPSRHFDVGGPDRLRYGALLDAYTSHAGLRRPQVKVSMLPTALVGTLVGSLTDVPRRTVEALVESLHHDMVSKDDDFSDTLLPPGHQLVGLEEAFRRALAPPGDAPRGSDPMGPLPQDPAWASGGDGRTTRAKVVDAVRDVLTTPDGGSRAPDPRTDAVPDSIDGVVRTMTERLDALTPERDHLRSFLGTYRRTTLAVGRALDDGLFEDPAWVERWDVAFAEIYLDALDAYLSGGAPARPWRLAFDAPRALPGLGHVLLGVNAHVNYDLPQALLAVISDSDFGDPALMSSRRRDHERIDAVLAGRVAEEDNELGSHGRSLTNRVLRPVHRLSSKRFLREARAKVWHNTLELQAARVAGRPAYDARLAELEVLSAARVADILAPGQVLLRLAVAGFGVTLPPA